MSRVLALGLAAAVVGGHSAAAQKEETVAVITRRDLIEPLTQLGERSPAEVRVGGAWALGHIGPTAAPAIPDLVHMLSDRRDPVRRQAAWALWKIGSSAVPELLKALESENPRTRVLAAWILGTMRGRARGALDAVTERYLDEGEDRRVRRMAFRARQQIRGAKK